ncbi:MAG: NADH-quinone oxidoreductase subunit NuoG [Acidimicrobiales bacterium]|nr:NADH-quinone oxidoreductase subunit NuoG [Acidimicrobiales bacterium]
MTTEREMVDTVTITVDGVEHQVPAGELLIKAAQDKGTYIPRFCWHERMAPVGMCRMCLVEIETPRGPALVPACTTPVNDGMVVDTKGATVAKAQEAVLEYLLINHPLDCPVCDKGGECPLQDQAMSHGPGESRFVEFKRTFEKPISISELVLLDRERCILCARCTRFSEEVSGDPLIEFIDRGNHVQVNTFPDEPFRSYFSGNTVQICPVGALTAKPYRFRARPWDLEKVESSSLFDTAHPRIEIHTSHDVVLRFTGVDNDATNHGWLSDKARFGFQYISSDDRVLVPLVRQDGEHVEAEWNEALQHAADRLGMIKDESGGEALAVLGGAQGTNEDAYALSRFARQVLGTNNVDARMDDALASHFLAATVDRARINDLDTADTIVLWGPDLKEEHPTLYLRARRAAQDLGVELVVVHPRANGLDDRAGHKITYRPGGGFALLEAFGRGDHPEFDAAVNGKKVVALVGMTDLADGPKLPEAVAAYLRSKAASCKILPLNSRGNTYGALDMGLAPDLLPGRVALDSESAGRLAGHWGQIPARPGRDTRGILEAVVAGEIRGLVLVGADPVRDVPDSALVAEAFEAAEFVVSIDTFVHDSNRSADVILPAATLSEKDGTVTNVEGRVQRVNQIRRPPGQTRTDWAILEDLSALIGSPMGLTSAETITKEIAEVAPVYAGVSWDLLEWDHRDGVVLPIEGPAPLTHIPVMLEGHGAPQAEFTLHAARVMYDDGVRLRHSPALRKLAPGAIACINPADAPKLGAREGARVRLVTRQGEGEFDVVLDEGTPSGVVYVPLNQRGGVSLGTDPVVRVTVVT